ncbi:unnamed protein product [Trypanosoma congolense IL3000]|uniref:WGS project CAEQ00000000 data, annotated contig 2080 n=1 Tax=Trypanosoma congolense (strain IL3000) TaxID=1068625 RepID=F9WBA0_TRYCI|nr:unnamed protein product [Trypanosoma congolense IL3000]
MSFSQTLMSSEGKRPTNWAQMQCRRRCRPFCRCQLELLLVGGNQRTQSEFGVHRSNRTVKQRRVKRSSSAVGKGDSAILLNGPFELLEPMVFCASYPCGREDPRLMRRIKGKLFLALSGAGGSDVEPSVDSLQPRDHPERTAVQSSVDISEERGAIPRTCSNPFSESTFIHSPTMPIFEVLAPRFSPHRNIPDGLCGEQRSFRGNLDSTFSTDGTPQRSTNNRVVRLNSRGSHGCIRRESGQPSLQRLSRRDRLCAALGLRSLRDCCGDVLLGSTVLQDYSSPFSSLRASTSVAVDVRLSSCDAPLDTLMTSVETSSTRTS